MRILILIAALHLTACDQPISETKDIGLVDSEQGQFLVLYSDEDTVHLKECIDVTAPLDRDCPSNEEQDRSMGLGEYLKRLDRSYPAGSYAKDQSGLKRAEQTLQAATKAAQDPNNTVAQQRVKQLSEIANNIKAVLKIVDDLSKEQRDLTYYDFDQGDDFGKLLAPFVTKPVVEEIKKQYDFKEDLALVVAVSRKWGFVDKQGRIHSSR